MKINEVVTTTEITANSESFSASSIPYVEGKNFERQLYFKEADRTLFLLFLDYINNVQKPKD